VQVRVKLIIVFGGVFVAFEKIFD